MFVFWKPFGGFVGLSEPYGSVGGLFLLMKNEYYRPFTPKVGIFRPMLAQSTLIDNNCKIYSRGTVPWIFAFDFFNFFSITSEGVGVKTAWATSGKTISYNFRPGRPGSRGHLKFARVSRAPIFLVFLS